MSKGTTFLAVTLALAAGVGGGMMAGVKTAQNKEEKLQATAVEQAEDKGYEAGYQAGIVVNQGHSDEELEAAVAEAEQQKQAVIDDLTQSNQTLTQEKTELTEQNQTLTAQNTNLSQQNETLSTQNQALTTQNESLTTQNETLTAANQALEAQIAAGAVAEVVAPGLYDQSGEITKTWQELIEEEIISIDENGVCKMNIDIPASGNYRPYEIDGAEEKLAMMQGKLVLSQDVRVVDRYGFAYAEGLTELVVPEGVVEIKSQAFRQCNLEKVTLPESLTTIGSQAFGYNHALQEINIPSGITAIPSSLFYAGYNNLNKVLVIPDGVETIGKKAFMECDGIIFVPDTVQTINADSFGDNTIVLFEANSIPGNVTLSTQATVVLGVSKTQINYFNAMTENANILTMTDDGVVVFQDRSKIKFYNIAEENLITWGTDSQNNYAIFENGAGDFILNNSEATYFYNSTDEYLLPVNGLQVNISNYPHFYSDGTNHIVYIVAEDGIYKIDTNTETLSNAVLNEQNGYQKIFNGAVQMFTFSGDYCVFATDNATYEFDCATGTVSLVKDSVVQYNDIDEHGVYSYYDYDNGGTRTFGFMILNDGTFIDLENNNIVNNGSIIYAEAFAKSGYTNYAILENAGGQVYIYNKTDKTFTLVENMSGISAVVDSEYFILITANNEDFMFSVGENGYSIEKVENVESH